MPVKRKTVCLRMPRKQNSMYSSVGEMKCKGRCISEQRSGVTDGSSSVNCTLWNAGVNLRTQASIEDAPVECKSIAVEEGKMCWD